MSVLNLETIECRRGDGVAWLVLNRPDALNAWTRQLGEELTQALDDVAADPAVRAIVLTGAGRAFSSGADLRAGVAGADGKPDVGSPLREVYHPLIMRVRTVPKPVIAAVNGLAIGGGHVLHVLCDLTIAADTAQFGQNGPRVGSFDAGMGSGYLARVIGEKRTRELWFMLRRLSAAEALDWGLVNKVVPAAELRAEVRAWADQMMQFSPTALKVLKQSLNTDTEHFMAIGSMAYTTLKMFGETPEAQEGIRAFNEKRQPDFSKYRGA